MQNTIIIKSNNEATVIGLFKYSKQNGYNFNQMNLEKRGLGREVIAFQSILILRKVPRSFNFQSNEALPKLLHVFLYEVP